MTMKPRSDSLVARPLGLSIAIASAIMFFGLMPLLRFYMAWRLNQGISGDDEIIGTTFPLNGFSYFSAVMGAIVVIAAVLAWRGKPVQVRLFFLGTVVVMSLALIGENVYNLANPPTYWSSADQMLSNFLLCQLPFQILSCLYIIWYCNRAPARAFYRQEPLLSWQQLEAKESASPKGKSS